MHRVILTEKHYDLVRRYMVVHRLPNARAATLRMIEEAVANGKVALQIPELEEADAPGKSEGRESVLSQSSA